MGTKKSKQSFPDARRSVAEAPAARSLQSKKEAENGRVRCEKVLGLAAGAQQQQPSLPVRHKVGKPRFDEQEKLLYRFYEPLVLLHTLDPVRGAHLERPTLVRERSSELGNGELRRTFLDKVSYVCDYKTGGATVTAVAMARGPEKITYVVAANNNVGQKVLSFLESILLQLKNRSALAAEDSTRLLDKLSLQCIHLSKTRIETYWRFLQTPLRRCIKLLAGSRKDHEVEIGNELAGLLEFRGDMHRLCNLAYEFRRSKSFAFLTCKVRAIAGASEGINLEENDFVKARHHIGRLGSHLTAARTLINTAVRIPSLFDDFEVRPVPCQPSSLPPAILDDKVTLSGILNRMMPSGCKEDEFEELKDALQHMNEKLDLEAKVRDAYESKNFQPQVHAELTNLEYFYNNNLDFVDGDRYIGCSKPACYCCWLYIRAHPGRFAEPACHSKIYLNWKPPSPCEDGSSSGPERGLHIRDLLNEMVKTVRADAEAQIMARSCRRRLHPDSTTGITASIDQGHLQDLPVEGDAGLRTLFLSGRQIPASNVADKDLVSHAISSVESSEENRQNGSGTEESDDDGGVPLVDKVQ